ncbi:hypothetical protein ACX12E_06825 [Paenibacillus vandeheii]
MNEPKTPNLGLNKIDRSSPSTTYFDLDKYLDQNWEKIDDFAEQVEGKAGETAAQVSRIKERLDTEQRKSVTLEPGLQIINAERASAFKLEGLKGRTLVNLLGRDGNCESTARWLLFQGAASTDPVNKTESSNGIKLTVTSGSFATGTALNTINAKANKFYIAVVDAKNGNATNASFYVNGLTATKGVNSTSDATKFVPLWRAYAPTSDVVASVIIQTNSSATGQFAYFDAVRFYEITAAEYTALDSMTPEQIAAKYSYVDSVTPVRNPYAIRYGENLLPPFYEYESLAGLTTSPWIFEEPYTAVQKSNSIDGHYIRFQILVVPNSNYTLTCDHNGYVAVTAGNGDNKVVAWTNANEVTFNVGQNSVIYVFFGNYNGTSGVIGSFTFRNPMLNIGNTAKPFKPREDAMLALQTDLYADPLTGAKADEVFEKDGQYFKLAKWKKIVLDEQKPWAFSVSESGHKVVYFNLDTPYNPVTWNPTGVKYDGKILSRTASGPDRLNGSSSDPRLIALSIPNIDSGWGDSYTPTTDEIKAYFMGWRMYQEGDRATPYTSGTKQWFKIQRPADSSVPSFPTVSYSEWSSYQLLYQLATPTVDPITAEGQLTFIEGNNQVEVGTGIVLHESAKAYANYNLGQVGINAPSSPNYPGSGLKNKVSKLLKVYRDGRADNNWVIKPGAGITGGGTEYADTSIANYDPSAAYSVTYLMLDTFPVVPFVGSVPDNEKALLTDLVQDVQQANARISVVENKKAGKDSPAWITPTLLNGWINYGGSYVPIRFQRENNIVVIQGMLKAGVMTSGTVLFILPVGYRPKSRLSFTVFAYPNVLVRVDVWYTGEVILSTTITANDYMSLTGISFLAEQ